MTDENKYRDGSVSEEASAFGKRVKGAAKDGLGAITGNESLERDGERENAEGRKRQERNDVFDDTDGGPGGSVTDRTAGSTRGSQADSVLEETAAFGQRAKGAAKDATGSLLGLKTLEREGERENAEGRARQSSNNAVGGTSRPGSSGAGGTYRNMVTGLYDTPDSAGKAYEDLTTRHGYKTEDISVVMSDETRKRHFGNVKPGNEFKEGSKAAEGAGIGGGIGIGVGAALGALVAAATAIAIPGIGLIVAGPIAGAIAGAGAGAATGTLIGALIGAGIPENRAADYERGIKEGGIVLGTRARDESHASELERDFTTHGARDILR